MPQTAFHVALTTGILQPGQPQHTQSSLKPPPPLAPGGPHVVYEVQQQMPELRVPLGGRIGDMFAVHFRLDVRCALEMRL